MNEGKQNFVAAQWVDRWTFWLWVFLLSMNFSLALAIWAAFDTRAGAIDFLACLLGLLYLASSTPLEIRIENEWLYIGKAKIELKYIGEVIALESKAMARIRTQDANPDAYLDLRFWVQNGIKIQINDSRDYTPYWLISTNKADEIIKYLMKKN